MLPEKGIKEMLLLEISVELSEFIENLRDIFANFLRGCKSLDYRIRIAG